MLRRSFLAACAGVAASPPPPSGSSSSTTGNMQEAHAKTRKTTGMSFFMSTGSQQATTAPSTDNVPLSSPSPVDHALAAERASSASGAGAAPHSGATATTSSLLATPPPLHAPTRWMEHSSWAALGTEFKHLSDDKFLQPSPVGFLTPRAVCDVQPAEELLADKVALLKESYDGVDVRDPTTAMQHHQGDTTWVKQRLSMGDKVRAVAEFVSGHITHQVSLPQWKQLFDLQQVEMDLMFWLWVIHLHIIARRAVTVNIDVWARRREVLGEMLQTMIDSWSQTSREIMGREPLRKLADYIKDMYYVTGMNLDEALLHDGPGGDMMVMGCLMKFCPLPRPEDVPVYTYYTLVHYIRFHTALFDRLSDEDFAVGNYHFLPPDDRTIFAAYTDVEFDQVARSWTADGADLREARERGDAQTEATSNDDDGASGSSAAKMGNNTP